MQQSREKDGFMILAGDIGGTNTRLAYFEKGEKIVERKYPSREYPGLEPIVKEFLNGEQKKISRACFGVAGAVRNGKCKATNLPWILDEAALSETLGIPARLLNDLEANAYGLRRLKKDELYQLQAGERSSGNQALVSRVRGWARQDFIGMDGDITLLLLKAVTPILLLETKKKWLFSNILRKNLGMSLTKGLSRAPVFMPSINF